MSGPFTVNSRSDVASAVSLVRDSFRERGVSAPACPLIAEALLLHLLDSGCAPVTVGYRGGRNGFIEIRAAGERDTFEVPSGADEDGRIEAEINLNILAQYAEQFDCRYQKGVNRYRIYPERRRIPDLSAEIYDFYAKADDAALERPLSVLLRIFGNHRARFVAAMIVKSVKHIAALMLPVFAANIIDSLAGGNGVFFSWPVLLSIFASVTALLVNLVCFWIDSILYHRFTRAVESGFKMAIVRKLEALSIRYHQNTQSGKLLSKLISDVQFIGMLIYDRLGDVLHLGIDVVFVIVTALLRFPPMLLFYLVIVPAATLFIRSFMKPVLESKAFMRRQTETSNAAFQEMLEMSQLTRSHGLEKTEYRRISEKVLQVQQAADRYDQIGVWVNNVSYGGAQGFRLVCLCFAAFLASRGYISIGTVVLFQSIFEMIIGSVQKVLDELPQITQGYDSLVSVSEILRERDVETNGSRLLPEPVRGEIRFRDVVFRYAPKDEPVLRGLNFDIPAGTSAAFIGKSGAGKTSLLSLMLGLYDYESGNIRVDGIELRELDKHSYRRHIAVVPQNTVLFSGTLWDNLVYGLSYVTTAQVLDALRRVGLQDLLDSLPDGLNTRIFEGGSNLSGGQRQRIAIARALLRDARIILFDEATSALDEESERQVQAAIDAVMDQCTVVMVAHRLGTLRKVDVIYRIEDGRAIPYDSYEQVLREVGGEEALKTEYAVRK